MQKLPGKRFGILITVALVIILTMGLYYIYTQNVKEAKVKRQAFKALYRYAGDLKEKERDVKKTFYTKKLLAYEYLDKIKSDIKRNETPKAIIGAIARINSNDTNVRLNKNCLDSIYDVQISKQTLYEKRIKKSVTSIRSILQRNTYGKIKDTSIYSAQQTDFLEYDLPKYDIGKINLDIKNLQYDRIKEDFVDFKTIWIDKDALFNNVLDKKFFSGFIAFDSAEVIYNQFDYTYINLKQKESKQSFRLDTLLYLFKSNNNVEVSLEGGSTKFAIENPYELQIPITLKGEDYQLFIVKVDGDKVHFLAALMPQTKYASLKRGFDRGLISAITVFVLLLLLSIPVIKLFVVAPGEAYTIRSLTTLVISTVGLVFIVSYFILYQSNLKYIKAHVKEDGEHLQLIADTIRNSFTTELDTMKCQLKQLRSSIAVSQVKFDNVYEKNDSLLRDLIKEKVKLRHSNASWMDAFIVQGINKQHECDIKEGVQKTNNYGLSLAIVHNCNRYNDVGSKSGINLIERDYVVHPDRFKKGTLKFGLESIFSVTTAKPQVVISSMVDSSSYIACIGNEMSSVSNTILPHGYSFCIIDKDGKVWFHQDPKNNIRENLFSETDHHPDLKAAVASHCKDVFKADYKMKSMLMHVEPLDSDIGLFVVSMCEVNNYIQLVNQVGYISIAAYILILLSWLFITWIYRIWLRRNIDVNNMPHLLLYFFPHAKESSKYISLSFINVLMVLLWLVSVLILAPYIYVIHWISLLALIGASTITWHIRFFYRKDRRTLSPYALIKRTGYSIIILGLIEVLLTHTCYCSFSLLMSALLIVVHNSLLYILIKTKKKWLDNTKQAVLNTFGRVIKSWHTLENKYYTYILTLLVLFVLVPLGVLYTVTYQQEFTLHYMAQQRYIADQLVVRRDTLKQQNNVDNSISILEQKGNYYEQFHKMKYCTDSVRAGVAYCKACKNYHKQNTALDSCQFSYNPLMSTTNYVRVFGQARANMFFINNLIEDRGNRVKPSYINSDDPEKRYSYLIAGDSLYLHVKQGGLPHNNEAFYIKMEKPDLNEVEKRYLGILYGLIFLIILYFIVMPKLGPYLFPQFKYTRKFFTGKQSEEQLHHLVSGENKYIVTMPDKAFYHKCIESEQTKMYRLHLPDSMNSFLRDKNVDKHVYLFIDHMSFKGVNQLTSFVEHLEKVMEAGHYLSFNIVCFKVPRILIQHFRDSLISELRKNNKKTLKKRMELETTLKRLINCLAYFSMSYVPLMEQPLKTDVIYAIKALKFNWRYEFFKGQNTTNNDMDEIDIVKWKRHLDWIEAELEQNAALTDKYKLFVRQVTLSDNSQTWDNIKKNQIENIVVNEDNVYQAYLINRTYYQKIWDSCSNEEKSILYDIAEDYVINLHKNGVVSILINKGLIKNGQFLKLFNLSFTVFVIRQADEVEVINHGLRERSKAGWNQYSLPLKLMGVAIVVFLIVTQQEFLTGIQSILISAGAILTFALRFFNFPLRGGS